MTRSGTCALALMFLALLEGQNSSPVVRDGRFWTRTVRGTVSAANLKQLQIATEGNVTLNGSAENTITYSVTARVNAAGQREAESVLSASEPLIRVSQNGTAVISKPALRDLNSYDISVTAPANLAVFRIDTARGNVEAVGLNGALRADSAAGRIRADRINGPANLRTGGGEISIGTINGPVHSFSAGGSIRVDAVAGESWFGTAGGEITIRDADGAVHATTEGGNIRIERAGGSVIARTAGGLIQVQKSAGTVLAQTSAGAIQIDAAQGVTCESARGAIRLRNVAGPVRATTAAGSILAELLSGNRLSDSVLTTNAGDITVLLSSKIPVTVKAVNNSDGMMNRIMSDFREIRLKPLLSGVPAVAEGSLNGGGPMLRVVTSGGIIYLRRDKD